MFNLNITDAIPANFMSAGGKRLSPVAYVFLVLVCIGFFTPGLATLPPTDRDESSFAQATKQMIEHHDYTNIYFQDKPRYKKPIGIYWLQATSVRLLNPGHLNEIWAYRLPSMIGATIAVLMTAALGALLFGPTEGLLGAIMMAGCVILDFEAHLAKTDAVLLATIMMAQYALARAYLGRSDWGGALLFWSAVAFGVLLKGPIILVVLASTLLWLRLSEKNLRWFARLKPYAGIPYALALIVPWFLLVTQATHGLFFEQSAERDLLAKIWQGQDRGMMPPGMHLLVFPLMFFPFSLVAILAAPATWQDRREKAVRFCLGWIIPTWIVFELSLTKLPHYVLPTYPAIALLAARALIKGYPFSTSKKRHWLAVGAVTVWFMVGTLLAVSLCLLPELLDQSWSIYPFIAGFTLLLAQSVALFILPKHKTGSVVVMTLGGLVFSAIAFGQTLPALQHAWMSREIIQMAELIKPCDDIRIASVGYEEPSLVFLAGTDTSIALDGSHVAAAMQHDPCRIGVTDEQHLKQFHLGFSGAAAQPYLAGTAYGFDLARGKWPDLSFYVMPRIPEHVGRKPK
jgi:4-amino-4-deoxy-L-arabinose transferase-like glycosyltransferase